MKDERKEIEMLMSTYISAWHEQDWEGWGELFEEESDFISWRGWWGKTRSENAALHREVPIAVQRQMLNYSLRTEKITFLSKTIALVHAKWIWRNFSDQELIPSDREGIITMVLVKRNEAWLIKAFHNSRIIN